MTSPLRWWAAAPLRALLVSLALAATPVAGQQPDMDATPAAPPAALVEIPAATPSESPAIETVVAPETDRLLWCASAFYWLAGSAEDSGDTDEAELYDRWSTELTAFASEALTALGYAPERIERLIAHYDQVTLVQIGEPDAPHDVVNCAALAPAVN